MTDPNLRSAPARPTEIRAEIRAEAAAMGVDEAYLSLLVDSFYGRVREDATLGPIFEERLAGNWGPHLARMKAFWSSVALHSGAYSGKPVPAHMVLTGVRPAHFEHWLGLFRATLEDTAPTPEAVPYLMEKAERIAASLQLAMFGLPELDLSGYRPPR